MPARSKTFWLAAMILSASPISRNTSMRAGVEDAGRRVRLGLGIALDQRNPDAGAGEKKGERQPGRPGANHHNPTGSVRHPSLVSLRNLLCRPLAPHYARYAAFGGGE